MPIELTHILSSSYIPASTEGNHDYHPRSCSPSSSSQFNASTKPSLPITDLDYQMTFSLTSPFCLDGKVALLGKYAEAAGGYADIWKGSLAERPVAIKVMRRFKSSGGPIEQTKLLKVCPFLLNHELG
jgi:hypothetical protein